MGVCAQSCRHSLRGPTVYSVKLRPCATVHTKSWAHLWDAVYPQNPVHTSGCVYMVFPIEAWRHEEMEHLWSAFFFFFDSTDTWKRFASFLWKLGWGLFKPASEDPHLERRFYILLFLGSTWLFPSHLLATTWILILCVCSFVHSFIHSTNMISMPVVRLTMVPGAGLQDRYMSPYSETRLYPGIKYFFFFLLICVKQFIVTNLYCIHDKTWLAQSWQSLILELGSLGSNPSCPVICCN